MVILLEDILDEDVRIGELLQYDTKENILGCYHLLGIKIPSRACKAELIDFYARFFEARAKDILNEVPDGEWQILLSLVNMQQGAYITVPRNDEQYLFIQNCYLVLTYQAEDSWHLYMCDNVRRTIKNAYNSVTAEHYSMNALITLMDRAADLAHRTTELLEQHEQDKYSLPALLTPLRAEQEVLFAEVMALAPSLDDFPSEVYSTYRQLQEIVAFTGLLIATSSQVSR